MVFTRDKLLTIIYMREYYYTDGQERFGPFTFEQLKEKEITPDTKVWFMGIPDWKPAKEVPELTALFYEDQTPPPVITEFEYVSIKNKANGSVDKVTSKRWDELKRLYGEDKYTILGYVDTDGKMIKNPENITPANQPPKSYLTESILVVIFCCLPFGIVGIVNASKVESLYYAGRIEESEKASKDAKMWVGWGFGVGLAVSVIYIILKIAYGSHF